LYFAWMQGLLAVLGWPPPADPREPQRLERQIAPEQVRLLNGPQGAEAPRPAARPAAEPVAAPEPEPTTADGAPAAQTTPPPEPAPAGDAHANAPSAPAPAPASEAQACWQATGFSAEQTELL